MMNKLLALSAVLLATGCLADGPNEGPRRTAKPRTERLEGRMPMPMVDGSDFDVDSDRDATRTPAFETFDDRLDFDLCSQVVETEGACAVACEPEKLLEYIPAGTCALIVCTLEDGRRYNTGGCNW